jgi:hypothetical protein
VFDPDFCEHRCPICTRARDGNKIARVLQVIEMVVTFGGCPFGRARQSKYGVRPDEPIPLAQPDQEQSPQAALPSQESSC